MIKKTAVYIVLGLSVLFSAAAVAQADNYAKTIQVFKESPVVAEFFKNAYGYAVFPTVGKAGFVIGGSYGKGQVYRGGKVTGKSALVEGSIGFQLGGTAQAVAITAGAQAKAGTEGATAGASAGPRTAVQADTKYHKGMVTFVHAKGGLMYEVSIGGQKFTFEPL